MKRAVVVLSILGSSVFSGCAGHVQTSYEGNKPIRRVESVAVADPVFLQDLPGAYEGEVLWSGLYVGSVVFSGGFIVEERQGGLEHRSKEFQVDYADIFREQSADVVSVCVQDGLGREGRDWVSGPSLDTAAIPMPSRRNERGTVKADGRDNQPLPRFTLTPAVWEGGAPVPAGADALLVPYIVHYYAHNGGWFLGQTYGTAGGARLRVVWALYDADGSVISYGDHQTTTEEHGVFSPNSQQLQDYLIDVEQGVCRDLSRHLP